MKERDLICIICPKGCPLHVEFDDSGEIKNITGYTCKRGEVYARTECTNPTRTVTTTVRCNDGSVVPVKTTVPVPKKLVFEVMECINRLRIEPGLEIGDVVIERVADTDADIVITGKAQ